MARINLIDTFIRIVLKREVSKFHKCYKVIERAYREIKLEIKEEKIELEHIFLEIDPSIANFPFEFFHIFSPMIP